MSYSPQLLYTKVAVPTSRGDVISRPHLDSRLQQSVRCPLTLISAPAGAGKTTIITSWHRTPAAAHIPIAWVSLTDDDNDLLQFTTYLAAALDSIFPGALAQVAPLSTPTQTPPVRVLASGLINAVDSCGEDFLLVLDDYHRITADVVHDLVAFLIEHMPPQMHLVLTTREDPPLPLARLRASGQMVEIREADMRFTFDETAAFLRNLFDLTLTDVQIAALDERIEGWAAGLKLAALAMRERTDVSSFIEAFSGSHRYIVDYLMEEVFERQPEDIQQFLLETSILREMNADLCDAVTGRRNSQHLLEHLVRLNLFTVPLDDADHWFRYHHLFAEVLKNRLKRLSESDLSALYQRAAAWHAAENQVQMALHYLLEIEAYEDAALIIEARGFDLVEHEGYEKPLRWLRHIPTEVLSEFPNLLLLAAFLYTKTDRTHIPEVRRLLEQAQATVSRLPTAEAQVLQAKIDVIESIRAQELENDLPRSRQLVDGAILHLKAATHWYIIAAMQKTWLHRLSGEVDEVVAIAREIGVLAEQHGLINAMLEAYKISAIALQHTARFSQAMQILEEAVGRAKVWDQTHHIELANVYFNLSRIALLRGDPTQAERFCRQTLEISEAAGVMALNIPAWLHLAETEWFLGRREDARTSFAQARLAIDEYPDIENLVEKSTAAYIATLLDEINYARQWMRSTGFNPRPSPAELEQYLQSSPWLLYHLQLVHVLLADLAMSDQPLSCWDSVRLWAGYVYQVSGERKALVWEIRALALLAVAHQESSQPGEALDALRSALSLAEAETLVYPFTACGAPMRGLLRKLHHGGESSPFVAQILAAFDELARAGDQQPSQAPETPFERLTEREREILFLVADGLSNTEIAQKLYLSIGTVKRHVANIFIKLGAESRTHALAIARKHGLI